jgi:hypothetical protein
MSNSNTIPYRMSDISSFKIPVDSSMITSIGDVSSEDVELIEEEEELVVGEKRTPS